MHPLGGTDGTSGDFVHEISDVLEPAVYSMVEAMREAARDWDGRDTIREPGL